MLLINLSFFLFLLTYSTPPGSRSVCVSTSSRALIQSRHREESRADSYRDDEAICSNYPQQQLVTDHFAMLVMILRHAQHTACLRFGVCAAKCIRNGFLLQSSHKLSKMMPEAFNVYKRRCRSWNRRTILKSIILTANSSVFG